MKPKIKYGIAIIPKGSALCTLEKGGDKDGKAMFRFSETHTYTPKTQCILITNETIMYDLYGAEWVRCNKKWVKADGKITWYNSYEEAVKVKASATNRKQKNIRIMLTIMITVLIGYIIYKLIKNRNNTPNNEME